MIGLSLTVGAGDRRFSFALGLRDRLSGFSLRLRQLVACAFGILDGLSLGGDCSSNNRWDSGRSNEAELLDAYATGSMRCWMRACTRLRNSVFCSP
jgi:hypothetical protein